MDIKLYNIKQKKYDINQQYGVTCINRSKVVVYTGVVVDMVDKVDIMVE